MSEVGIGISSADLGLPPADALASVSEHPPIVEDIKQKVVNPGRPANVLSEKLKAEGVNSVVIPIPGTGSLTEAVVFPKKEIVAGKMVRVYRGVNTLDPSILRQMPYAMRVDSEERAGSIVLDNVSQEVGLLANEPTYEHLLAYINKVRPQLTESQQKRLDRDLLEIEEKVLEGYSLRRELVFDQIKHIGVHSDSGISPYISASWSPEEALKYTRQGGALMVIDIPISRIEDFRKDNTGTNIKGELGAEYVTAIIFRNSGDLTDGEVSSQEIETALQAVSDSVQVPVYDPTETRNVREAQMDLNNENDKQQHPLDVEAIRQKRTMVLLSQFSEVGQAQQLASETGTDIYTSTKTAIFDYYAGRLARLGRGRNVANYEYVSKLRYGAIKSFDRSNITDEMLENLRTLVVRQEQREQKRSQG